MMPTETTAAAWLRMLAMDALGHLCARLTEADYDELPASDVEATQLGVVIRDDTSPQQFKWAARALADECNRLRFTAFVD